MRKGVIKTGVMTASLGLALFFSSQALADNDQVFMICAKDAATGDYYISDVGASEGASLPGEANGSARFGLYVRRWVTCTRAGVTLARDTGYRPTVTQGP